MAAFIRRIGSFQNGTVALPDEFEPAFVEQAMVVGTAEPRVLRAQPPILPERLLEVHGLAPLRRDVAASVDAGAVAVQQVGGATILEYWIPAEDLEELNANIVGLIEVTAEYR
jgi:hypothetical protein